MGLDGGGRKSITRRRMRVVVVANIVTMAMLAAVLSLQGIVDQQVVAALAGGSVVAVGVAMGLVILRTRERAAVATPLQDETRSLTGIVVAAVVVALLLPGLVVWIVQIPGPQRWLVPTALWLAALGIGFWLMRHRRDRS